MEKYLSSGGSRGGAQGPGSPSPSPRLFSDQTEARRAEKNFSETAPPPQPTPLSQGLDLALLKYTKLFFLWATRFRKRTGNTE